jgi:hypothetical protein
MRRPGVDDTAEFLEQYRKFMDGRGRGRPVSPTEVIGRWESFVGDCEDGYGDNIDEFHNDLSVRGLIAEMLRSPELAKYGQMGWVRAAIEAIDARYRALLLDQEVRPGASWWKAKVPRFAGRELADDFRSWYQLEIEVRD